MNRTKIKLRSGLYETDSYKCLGNLNNDSVDLRLIYCGYEDCEAGHRFGPNKRTAYLLHFITKGLGKLEIHGETYQLKAGDAFLLRPGEEAYYEADHFDPWSYGWIGFEGMRAEDCVVNAGFDDNTHLIHSLRTDTLYAYIMEMLRSHDLSYANSLKRCAYLQLFLAEVVEQHASMIPGITHIERDPGAEHVKQIMSYIADHYSERIRINELADICGLNRCYLTTSFKKVAGLSPSEYLIRIRMEKAKSLLSQTNYSISRIANDVGYTDQFAFSKIFKERIGVSPKAYRQEGESLEILADREPEGDIYL